MAWMQALRLDTMYLSERNSMKIPFAFQSNQLKAEEVALLDSGAMETFITQNKVKQL